MKTSKVNIRICPNDFDQPTKEEMWAVYKNYYSYTKASFMSRFSRNNYYAMYRVGGRIIGFTGLRIDRQVIEGQKRFFIYFGQTVIDQAYRGKSLIQRTGLHLMVKFAKDILTAKSYWWADALTYRAYLVFSKSLTEYYPSRNFATPRPMKRLFNYIGEKHYGESYSPVSGTITKTVKYVNDLSVKISTEKLSDPDIRFYAGANPLHVQGNGLLVMAPITWQNVKGLIDRFFQKVLRFHPISFLKKKIAVFV